MPTKQNRVIALYLRVDHIRDIGRTSAKPGRKRNFVELPKDAEELPKDAEVPTQNAKVATQNAEVCAKIAEV